MIAPNWMQNFWANFLSIFCTGIVFIMSIVMHFRPKSWTKEKMISVSLGVTCLLFLATAFIGIVIDQSGHQTHSSSKTLRSKAAIVSSCDRKLTVILLYGNGFTTKLLFGSTTIKGLIDNRAWKEAFFWVNLLLATVLCAFCAVVQNIGMTMTSGKGNHLLKFQFFFLLNDRISLIRSW